MSKEEAKPKKFKGKNYRNMYCPIKRMYMDMHVTENNGFTELKFGDFFIQKNIRLADKKNSVQKELYNLTIKKEEKDDR